MSWLLKKIGFLPNSNGGGGSQWSAQTIQPPNDSLASSALEDIPETLCQDSLAPLDRGKDDCDSALAISKKCPESLQ